MNIPMNEDMRVTWKQRLFGCFLLLFTAAVLVLGILGYVLPFTSPGSNDGIQTMNTDHIAWESSGNGLAITVMNSCEDKWTPIFNVYIHAWDNGTPDALSLSTERHPHDPECKAHIGRINVCNGNYGRTDWQGVARLFRRANGFMISASALLNDYYLDGASQSQRLYTMCHEQGHAYGLPHTDTNHRNADLGNCLDYTITYSNNLMPGQINYDRLFQLYGSVNFNSSTTSSAEDHKSNGRTLSVSRMNQHEAPSSVTEKYNALVTCLDTSTHSVCMQRFASNGIARMLHQSKGTEACEFHFDGYVLESHKLLIN